MYNRIKILLNRGVSRDPLMLHGTSVEALFELSRTRKLPPGSSQIYYDIHIKEPGIHFVPNTFKYKDCEFLENIDAEACRKSAASYAKDKAAINYLANALGCKGPETYTIIANWPTNWTKVENITKQNIRNSLSDNGINISYRQMLGYSIHANKRRGIVIEPKESILELEKDHFTSGDSSIYIECPEGLDIKYIKGVELLGPVEKRMMQKFLDGKLEYDGFRTH